MKKILAKLRLIKKQEKEEMTLDEYIISIRPKTRELSQTSLKVYTDEYFGGKGISKDNDNGPEEAGCLVLA